MDILYGEDCIRHYPLFTTFTTMKTNDPKVNPYETPLVLPVRRDESVDITYSKNQSDRRCPEFTNQQLQMILDAKTEVLMKVAHEGPPILDSERQLLEQDLRDSVSCLPRTSELTSLIRRLDAIEHVLTTLVMKDQARYSMSQLWVIISKYLGPRLWHMSIDISRQPHWIAMRRTATAQYEPTTTINAEYIALLPLDGFSSPIEYLGALAWIKVCCSCQVTLDDIFQRVREVMGEGHYWKSIVDALLSSDPVYCIKRDLMMTGGKAWGTVLASSKSKPKKMWGVSK